MKKHTRHLFYLILFMISCQTKPLNIDSELQDPKLIQAVQQVTFQGPRAGEGYFNRTGSQMIFQSERESGNPFYQIYLMDMKTGSTKMVSPGMGKTTCAWIHPYQNKVMFSSTHQDKQLKAKIQQEYEQRKSPEKHKYSWSYDEQFEIFEYDLNTKKYKQLTKALGYDAEGSYSPDGKWIAFASNRSGYQDNLKPEEAKLFAQDPSYLMDIYLMKSNGTELRRLTETKGYDGGPFFSPDGKKITWRRFTPDGKIAEVWTMNVDGTEQKQITRLGAMSWAPFYHPSGDYIIFTTNKLGYANFELYIVDAEGKQEPVRASYWDGFDGLPVFTPDGKQLAWSHRNNLGESQIYMGKWDDSAARKLLKLSEPTPKINILSAQIDQEDVAKWVQYLAAGSMRGRKTGSPEEIKYTETIAKYFSDLEILPAGNSGYFDTFELVSGIVLGENNKLNFQGVKPIKAELHKDFIPLSFSQTGEFGKADLVFAGYGIVAPATESQPLFDSYNKELIEGKWAVVLRDIPEEIPNQKRIHLNMYSRLQHKALVAKQRGAKGLLIIQEQGLKLRFDGSLIDLGMPVISISKTFAKQLFAEAGLDLDSLQKTADTGAVSTHAINKLQVTAAVSLQYQRTNARNVIGKLVVPGAKTNIVIGAHGDHLGSGEYGSSLATGAEQGQIHPGADDNASGVAALMELAHWYTDLVQNKKIKLKHNIIFAVWSGEEMGLLGSTSYLKKYKKTDNVVAYLNMDMVGRLRENLMVQGAGSAKEWKVLLEMVARQEALPISAQDDPYLPTDSMAFYLKEIPTLHFFTGSHAEYHSPRDVPALVDLDGVVRVTKFVGQVADKISKPTYVKVEGQYKKMEGRSFRIYLGTIPDYSQEGVKGVRISGSTKNSPAEVAGLKKDDVIVELSGAKIENLYDYTYSLQALKANLPTKIKVLRQGKLETLEIVPKLKE